ncbi:MAG TPA: DUF4926 domain-containing protein [Pyrinomonadaceae bacterium]
MLDTKKAHELDIVELTEDLPEYGLRRGARGTVVEVFDEPEEAYMLEFVDDSGTSSKFADWVRPNQINVGTRAESRDTFPTRNKEVKCWYSIKLVVYHNNPDCNTGNNIEIEFLRQGTGDKPLCQECAHRNASR